MKRTAALLALLVSGCAVTYAPTKPGLTAEDMREAHVDCQSRFAAVQDGLARQGRVHECMETRGWKRESGW